jgi:FKBP-type peptidyl-prolyl cis-trans isomerase
MSILFISCEEDSQANKTITNSQAALETPKGRQSYAVGANFGKFLSNDLRQVEVDLDYSMILQGIKDQLDIKQDSTKQALMNDSAIIAALQELTAEMRNAQIAKDSILRMENLAKQNAFLEKNKGDTGVITTASGLQYKILAAGKGNLAKDGDTISVHYTGTLLDGTEFDSSIRRNQPLSIPLAEGQLISGWVEMLRLMKVSDKVKAWIPSHLAYGEQGNRGIPGNSMLIFEMELLDIKAAKK